MRNWTAILIACVVLPAVACSDDADGENNANADTNGNNSAAARCAPGEFTDTVVFDHDDLLPFAWEIPVGFGSNDSSIDEQVVGSTYNVTGAGAAGEFLNPFSLIRSTTTPDVAALAADAWVNAGATEVDIPYDGGVVKGYETVFEDRATLTLHLPVGTGLHQLTMRWDGPASCADEREAIRAHAMATFTPNPDTTFP